MSTPFPDIHDIASEVVDAAPTGADPMRTYALAELSATELGLEKLRAEFGSIDYDPSTPFGYKLATTRRHAVRLVRFQVPKAVQAAKARLKALGGDVEAEGDRIIALLREIEDPHHELIEAENARRAEAKRIKDEAEAAAEAEAARVEAQRIEMRKAAIGMIRSYLDHCRGLPSDRIQAGIDQLDGVPVDDAFEEFAEEALRAKADTLEAMRQLHTQAVAAEAEAARMAALRVEQARIAVEQAESQRVIAAKEAEIAAQYAALRRAQEADAERVRVAAAIEAAKRQADEAPALAVPPPAAKVAESVVASVTAPATKKASETSRKAAALSAIDAILSALDADCTERALAVLRNEFVGEDA